MSNKIFRFAGFYVKEERTLGNNVYLLVTNDKVDETNDVFHLEIEYESCTGDLTVSQCYEHEVLPYKLLSRDRKRLQVYVERNYGSPSLSRYRTMEYARIEADNHLFNAYGCISRIYSLLQFEEFSSENLPQIDFSVKKIPHQNAQVDIFLKVEFMPGVPYKLDIRKAESIMLKKGVITPSDFENK